MPNDENRDYHCQSQSEIAGAKRISRPVSRTAAISVTLWEVVSDYPLSKQLTRSKCAHNQVILAVEARPTQEAARFGAGGR